VVLGCDGDAPSADVFAVRDSSGVRIVENEAPQWTRGLGWSVAPEPTFDLSGASDETLYRPSSAQYLPDGRLALYNGNPCEIRIYSHAGAMETSFGACGQGPGEFRAFGGIWPWPGDSLAIVDQMPRRLSIYGVDGALARTVPISGTGQMPLPFVVGVLGDGTLVLRGSSNPVGRASPGVETEQVTLALGRIGEPDVQVLGSFPGVVWEYSDMGGGGSLGRGPLAFSGAAGFAAGDSRVYVGLPDRYRIEVFAPGGTLELVVRRAFEAREVTAADIDWLLQRRLQEVADPAAQRVVRQAYRDLQHASTMPAFGPPAWPGGAEGGPALLPDEAGNLWVFEHYRPGEYANVWSVFSPQGIWLGQVELPDHLHPTQIGDAFVLGRWEDDTGFVHVRRYTLVKPPGSRVPTN
jgi:hypothetical protein